MQVFEMTDKSACKYWDCGWCYAPNYLKTNAINSTCVNPYECPISPLSEPVQYETPMTEIEELKAQIKVLEAKLSFLEELENHKTPCEEAYKRVYTYYPVTDITDPCWDGSSWMHFVNGYKSAQEDYKVGEFQPTPQEPEELKTLYQMFEDEGAYGQLYYDNALKVVKSWMSQYTCDYVMCAEYLKGYEECLTVLGENLK
jgi:hypothetical protein